jgi:hypothetical protein
VKPKNDPFHVFDERQSVRVAIATAVKVLRKKAVTAAAPEKRKALPADLSEESRSRAAEERLFEERIEETWKDGDDQRSEANGRRRL